MALPALFVSGHWRRRSAATSRLAGAWRTARPGGGEEAAGPGGWAGLGRAGPSWAELSAGAARWRTGGRAQAAAAAAAAAATMRWVRALLKNASLAGAPKYIEHFSKFSPSPLSIKQFLDFGTEWVGWGRLAVGARGARGAVREGALALKINAEKRGPA